MLWLDGEPTGRLQESMDRWSDNLLKDDGITHISIQDGDSLAFIHVKQKGILAGKSMVDRILSRTGLTAEWSYNDGDWNQSYYNWWDVKITMIYCVYG